MTKHMTIPEITEKSIKQSDNLRNMAMRIEKIPRRFADKDGRLDIQKVAAVLKVYDKIGKDKK